MITAVSVFDSVIGQDEAVMTLNQAASAAATIVREKSFGGDAGLPSDGVADPLRSAMTHAWLFTGPPGSGRSAAARAFAAALQCAEGGCGHCRECTTALAGTHSDVTCIVPEGLTIGVGEMRALVLRAAGAPSRGRWQVLIVEDADRLTEAASNALLKAVEEPSSRTVFLLCAPSAHPRDISITIRSRCRVIPLRQPSSEAITSVLVSRDGIDQSTASWAAAAAQGHVGRARRLATDMRARECRAAVLAIPRRLTGIGACFDAANDLIETAEAEASELAAETDAKEKSALEMALGAGGTGRGTASVSRGSAGQIKDLERKQKLRTTRAKRDSLDRALIDLAGFYRDVLIGVFSSSAKVIHVDMTESTLQAGLRWGPDGTLRRLEAVLVCRKAIERNVKPRIAVESMMLALWRG